MGMGRKEKPEADDSTHEFMEIGGVTVPVINETSQLYDSEFDSEFDDIDDEDSTSVSMYDIQPAETSIEGNEADESQSSEVSDFDLGDILQSTPPPAPRIEAPSDAQLNEHGQMVWRDAEGTVWVQNPDGSLLKHNILTGGWDSYEQ